MSSDDLITSLEAAVASSPGDVNLRSHLAGLLVDVGRHADAAGHIFSALETAPAHLPTLEVAVRHLDAVGDDRADHYRTLVDALSGSPASNREPVLSGDVVPDTAEELLESWSDTDALEDVDYGELSAVSVTLADVGGMEAVKTQLNRSFLAPMHHPEMAAAFGKSTSGGLILWGPPGCGKTFLARATAGEMGANFYNVALSDVLEMWMGASERNLARIFDAARRNTPCVLFFDEIDAIGQKRSHLRTGGASLRGVVNQLLGELDGVGERNDGVFVLAATNHPWDVDEALLRPGRFDRRLLVLPPDEPARHAILRYHLRGKPAHEVDLDPIVNRTDGYSGADLRLIVEEATEAALDASIGTGRVESITTASLERALASVKPSIGPWLEAARNHVIYANRSGDYDELEAYLAHQDRKGRR